MNEPLDGRPLQEPDLGIGPKTLPGQANHQGLQLFGAELQLLSLPVARPDEAPSIEPPSLRAASQMPKPSRFGVT